MERDRRYEEQLSPEHRSLWQEALRHLQAGRIEAAEGLLQRLLAGNPGFVPAINKLGVCRVRAGDREGARRAFERALELDHRYVPALSNLATTYLEEGDLDRAIDLYRQALAEDPDYAIARENLAAAYKRQGQIDAFVRELKRAYRAELRAGRPAREDEPTRRGCLPPAVLLAMSALSAAAAWLAR